VDNNFIGIAPLTVHDIVAGSHMVTFRKDGYHDYSTTAPVTAGVTSTVSAALSPVTAPTPKSPVFPLTALGALGIIGFFASRKPE
jgi:hypothetical protein